MTGTLPFEPELAQELRRDGQDQVERNERREVLDSLRELAKEISAEQGSVSTDELRYRAKQLGIEPHHHNVWGVVFRERGWECVGRIVSRQPQGHGNRTGRWRWTTP